ncbi:NAD(P)-dependent oxidoreductase [Amycolatopsis sp. Poz14]|uniref:NAD(P)-dependent oxidoreductase n=1 Tax=Amycolatopsis sp. Poz14 TaxID=1447705 RepID=UPI001EE7D846|nr:NAD(P)H-binding protein [Amycolatopsis sp. Poz14]MCG3749192.1 NAD(P)H-binding protein [Amycolatopsis sp. Poz14]
MKITVLGASGRIGGLTVREALARGWHVTAVVRDPARLTVPAHPRLDVAVHSLTDPSLADAVTGRDAVVLALGPADLKPTTVNSDGTRSVVTALHGSHTRFVVVSASGLPGDGDSLFSKLLVKPLLGAVLRNGYADLQRMESILHGAPDVRWTIVRPTRLTNKPAREQVRSEVGRDVRRRFQIPRANVARFLLDAAEDDALVGKTVSIAQ